MRKYLISNFTHRTKEIQQAIALLAFPENCVVGVYKNLYDKNRWNTLSHNFKLTAYEINGLTVEPMLNLVLSAGLSSLKLPCCSTSASNNKGNGDNKLKPNNSGMDFDDIYNGLASFNSPKPKIDDHVENYNVNCPTCNNELLGAIAKSLPHSHHTNSTIVCKLSGKVVNDGEMLAFPNGRVYSKAVSILLEV